MLVVGSDSVISLLGLQDSVSGSYLNAATVTGTVSDPSGNVVATLSFSYVSASNGNYTATLAHGTSLVAGQQYQILVTATSGSYVRVFEHNETAGYIES